MSAFNDRKKPFSECIEIYLSEHTRLKGRASCKRHSSGVLYGVLAIKRWPCAALECVWSVCVCVCVCMQPIPIPTTIHNPQPSIHNPLHNHRRYTNRASCRLYSHRNPIEDSAGYSIKRLSRSLQLLLTKRSTARGLARSGVRGGRSEMLLLEQH